MFCVYYLQQGGGRSETVHLTVVAVFLSFRYITVCAASWSVPEISIQRDHSGGPEAPRMIDPARRMIRFGRAWSRRGGGKGGSARGSLWGSFFLRFALSRLATD